ncbi:MAG: translation initiation factor IF-1 [Sandaracinaceae bacterium]|nr:translation initiation factor IF-1 [Sandaracinaceae bacterium]
MPNDSELEGIIDEALPRGLYAVRLDDGRRVRATLSTHAKRVLVKVLPGDRVLVELSAFDPSRGRITGTLA